jgi:hypothetical protein
VRFVACLAVTMLAIKLTGGSRQRLVWDQYFSFLRLFTFLRALPTLLTGSRGLRFRVTPKGAGERSRSSLLPHAGVVALNAAVIAALGAQLARHQLDTGTEAAVSIGAGAIAAVYLLALARLWRRVYRRNHYRVHVALPAEVTLASGRQLAARTEDVSFEGLSLVGPEPIDAGSEVRIRLLLEGDSIGIDATVVGTGNGSDGRSRIGVRFAPLAVGDEQRLLACLLEATIGTVPIPQRGSAPVPSPQLVLPSVGA